MPNNISTAKKEDRKYHVLMVDDNVQDFKLLSVMIRANSDAKYEFYWAKNSKEAEDALSNLWIDLVAVDYNLGAELGTDVIRKLIAKHPQIAYIMITGMEDPDLYKAGLEAGASDFIVKSDNNAKLFDQTVQFAVEHKRIENSLRASNEAKNRLMAILANDLELPLSNLVKSLALVRTQAEDLSKQDLKSIIDNSYKSSYEAMTTIRSILDWGKDQSGNMKPSFEMVNITESISHVFNFLAIESSKKDVELSYKGDCGLHAYADSKMLSTVLRNLISYAIRTTQKGSKIEVETQADEANIAISIHNFGVSVDPSKLSQMRMGIFDNLAGRKSKNHHTQSLEICRHLLDLMAVDLQIDSSEEQGITFSFLLPAEETAVELDEELENSVLSLINAPSA